MTLERASELVKALKKHQTPLDNKAIDLLEHFVNNFGLRSNQEIKMFANMCGYENAVIKFL